MTPEHTAEELTAIFQVVGEYWTERAPPGRIGVVVAVETDSGDLYWICEAMDGPVRRARAELIRDPDHDQPPAPTRLLEVPDIGPMARLRSYMQIAFAGPASHWEFGLLVAASLARSWALSPQGKKRSARTLRDALPYLPHLTPQQLKRITTLAPEYSRALSHRASTGRWPNLVPTDTHIPSALNAALAEAIRALLPDPGSEPTLSASLSGSDPFTPQKSSPEPWRPLTRIVSLQDPDALFYVLSDHPLALVAMEPWGAVVILNRADYALEDEHGVVMDTEEFDLVMASCFEDATSAPFVLGASLAASLGDTQAGVFWYAYGARWLPPSEHEASAVLLDEARSLLQQLPEANQRAWINVAPELAPRHSMLPPLRRQPVARLSNLWRSHFALPAMARRLYPEIPGLLEGSDEVFSFGPPPQTLGAPPSPRDVQPFRHLQVQVRPQPTPEPSVSDVPLPAISVQAQFLPPVQYAQTCLLQTDWNLPSGMAAFIAARQTLFDWLADKLGAPLPDRWHEGAHETEHKGDRLEVEASEQLIALRYEHPDHAHVARRWRIEMAVGAGQEGRPGVVAVRLLAIDATRLEAARTATPRVLRELLTRPGLFLQDHPVGQPWLVGSNPDWMRLREILSDRRRDCVVLVTGPEVPISLTPALAPLALHVQLQRHSLADYTRRFGALSPGTCHLYGLGRTVPILWVSDASTLDTALWAAHADRSALSPLPTFAELRRQLRDLSLLRRLRAAPAEQATPVLTFPEPAHTPPPTDPTDPTDSDALLVMAQHDLEQALADKRALEADLDQVTAQLRDAKAALYSARAVASPLSASDGIDTPAQPPADFAGLEAWLPLLSDRLVVASKAVKEAVSLTDYFNQAEAIAVIQALHSHYWPMVMQGDEAARQRWQVFLKDNRLRYGPVGTAPESSRYGGSYQVSVGKRTYTLDMHVQGHSARDLRRCLRLYFAVDKETQRIVIGHFPTHLPNSLR
jgi:hypothetical protein